MDPAVDTALDRSPVELWHAEHAYFARLLHLLQLEIDRFHAGERPNYELMRDVVHYLRSYSDAIHHPREDVAFERLAQHRPGMALELSRLRQEHRVVADAGTRLLELLDQIQGGAILPRGDVEAAAAMFLVYYRHHIGNEERDVLARAAECLTPADWAAVRAATPTIADPLFGVAPAEHFRELRRRIALDG